MFFFVFLPAFLRPPPPTPPPMPLWPCRVAVPCGRVLCALLAIFALIGALSTAAWTVVCSQRGPRGPRAHSQRGPPTGSLQVSAEAAAQPADPGHGHGSADGSDGDNDTVDVRGLPIRCFRSLNAAKGEKGILDLA